ncbi:MAG: NADH-ubiquinone oxidoreductase-F iron-sulfur binding region domain-containing protein [Candidatus Dormibacteria bacterium]
MQRLLDGPGGLETFADHTARLGARPPGSPAFIAVLAESGLQGRGGARFPAGRKWETVRANALARAVPAVVLVNGAEGEPGSSKDEVLLSQRPHLVIDGALIAAESVGADQVVFYIGQDQRDSAAVVRLALSERARLRRNRIRVRIQEAPARYVAGEESAAVHRVNGGEAKPVFVPPRPFESGVRGRPTLVQNVETLAHVALIARRGADWFRGEGTRTSPGTLLMTIGGDVDRPGVYEVAHGASLAQVVSLAGGAPPEAAAVLLGGYFGAWVGGHQLESVALDDAALTDLSLRIGCGVVHVLPPGACGVGETARILTYLANESARQCGPCEHGLQALAASARDCARGVVTGGEEDRLRRWSAQLASGRGACRHPDGAVGLLLSAMRVFEDDFSRHWRRGTCAPLPAAARVPIPSVEAGWR